MITYYVNVLGNSAPIDWQFQTVATLGVGSKIKSSGITYTIVNTPVFGNGNQAWVDVVPA